MKTFCVPSHHAICSDPISRQGVLLTANMLKHGLWYAVGGHTTTDDNEYTRVFRVWRSQNEAEHFAAMNALMNICSDDPALIAVISIRWCSLSYQLVTSKRVWLGIYHGDRHLLTYSHLENGQAVYNYCACWEDPTHDQEVWEARFTEAISSKL